MKTNAKFINTEKIEGYVYSTGSNFNQLSERISGENSKNPGTKYIAGDLDIAVDNNGLNVVTIHYSYVPESRNGSANQTYVNLKRIIDNPEKYWINGGKDNAFKVQCTGVAIAVNDFIAADGSKVAAIRNENGFCTIVNELAEEEKRNEFTVDMFITKTTLVEADPEKNIENDFLTISGCIFGYGPVLIPASFIVKDALGIKYFENLEISASNPVFTKVWGQVNCMTIKTEKMEESAFGTAAVKTYERKNKEYVITGSAKIPYDFGDEEVLTIDDINKMSQDRQVMLAEIEERTNKRKAEKAANVGLHLNKPETATIPEGGFVF